MSLSLAALVSEYMSTGLTTGNVVPDAQVQQALIDAVRKYIAYADLKERKPPNNDVLTISDIASTTTLTASEWGIIQPLFKLYAEQLNAKILEATRGMGLDVYGRSVSEVAADIAIYEEDLPHKCFDEDMFSVGQDGYDGTDDFMVGAVFIPPLIVIN